jgi:hypothetical protein
MFHHGPTPLTGPVSREFATAGSDRRDDDRPIRTELVARVRREIAEGTYDTPEKFEKALDKLLARLESDE